MPVPIFAPHAKEIAPTLINLEYIPFDDGPILGPMNPYHLPYKKYA